MVEMGAPRALNIQREGRHGRVAIISFEQIRNRVAKKKPATDAGEFNEPHQLLVATAHVTKRTLLAICGESPCCIISLWITDMRQKQLW